MRSIIKFTKKHFSKLILCTCSLIAIMTVSYISANQTVYAEGLDDLENLVQPLKSEYPCYTAGGAASYSFDYGNGKKACFGVIKGEGFGAPYALTSYQIAIILDKLPPKGPDGKTYGVEITSESLDMYGHKLTFAKSPYSDQVYLSQPTVDTNDAYIGYAGDAPTESDAPGIGCSSKKNGNQIKITANVKNGLDDTEEFEFNICENLVSTIGYTVGDGTTIPAQSGSTLIIKRIYSFQDNSGSTVSTKGVLKGNIQIKRDWLPDEDIVSKIGKLTKSGMVSLTLNGKEYSDYSIDSNGIITIPNSTLLPYGDYAVIIKYNDAAGLAANKVNIDNLALHYGFDVSEFRNSTITTREYKVSLADSEGWFTDSASAEYINSTDTGTTQDQDKGEETTTCAIEAVGWVVCPLTNFLGKIVDGSWNFLQGFLETKSEIVSNTSTTYTVWQAVRNIANVAFAIVFLIIIFSQVTSFGISNYGIKKMLPKLIIAAVLVNLSFYICQIAVDISNILGVSIKGFLDSFSNSITTTSPGFTSQGWLSTGGNGFATGIIGGIIGSAAVMTAAAYGALGSLILTLIGAVFALVMILVLLIGRQAVIILLVILSPLAFVAYLLPNTSKLFDKWKKTFMSLLLLYPIVALVVGASALASNILMSVFKTSDSNLSQIEMVAAAAVAILPLFVVPGMLKKSMDGIGNIGGTINKLGSSWGKGIGGLSKKGLDTVYKRSSIGRGMAARAQAREAYRNQQYAKRMTSNNPVGRITRAASRGIGITGAQKYANTQLEKNALAVADKIKTEEINQEAKRIETQYSPETLINNAQQEFEKAARNGDTIKARAAQQILLKTSKGRDAIHKSYLNNDIMNAVNNNATMSAGLRGDINLAGLKGKDAALNTLGYTAGTLFDIDNNVKTYAGLNASEFVGQGQTTFQNAINSGGLTREMAMTIATNQSTRSLMDKDKWASLETKWGITEANTSASQHQTTQAQSTQPTQILGTDGQPIKINSDAQNPN